MKQQGNTEILPFCGEDGAHRTVVAYGDDPRRSEARHSKPTEGTQPPGKRPPGKRPKGRTGAYPLGRWAVCLVLLAGLLLTLGSVGYRVAQDYPFPSTPNEWGQVVGGWLLSAGFPDVHTPLGAWMFTPGQPQDTTKVQEEGTLGMTAVTQDDPTVTTAQDDPAVTTAQDDPAGTAAEEQTTDLPAEGYLPITTLDMSLSEMGATYWTGDEGCRLPAYEEEVIFPEGRQTVLILHSHPYETYGTGEDRIPLSGDGWAVEVPSDGTLPEAGVVALGAVLERLLSERGIEVLRVAQPVDLSDLVDLTGGAPSYVQTHEMACAVAEDYLSRYPDIGLVIDLRRGAELLEDGLLRGSMPRTMTDLDGVPCAQIRILADSERGDGTVRDVAVAMALRQRMFYIRPTLSRPVHLRRGEGLTSEGDAAFLTIEIGTAGNTYAEAEASLMPLADALAALLTKK